MALSDLVLRFLLALLLTGFLFNTAWVLGYLAWAVFQALTALLRRTFK